MLNKLFNVAFKNKGGTVEINGNSFTGNSITITNGQVIVDGVSFTIDQSPVLNISVEGDIDKLETTSGDVTVAGKVGSISTVSGDVTCGDVSGSVETVSGDVDANDIYGKVSTVSGDIS